MNRTGKLLGAAALTAAIVFAQPPAYARGVSPYLPLNLSPAIERRIEQVLVLAGKPILRRPIAAATVLDALPRACAIDPVLCGEVRAYLDRFMKDAGVTLARVELAHGSGSSRFVLPNDHGIDVKDSWDVAGQGYYQFGDHALVNAGVVAHSGRVTPEGSVLSLGWDAAQLDIGYRDHWLSPLLDSSMLMSTEAPTMPSVTLSNYTPLGFMGFNYEVFAAEMSNQNGIAYFNTTTNGRPRLAGLQLGLEPVSGYSFALNRLFQYGGGARGTGGIREFLNALTRNGNQADVVGVSQEFGNQQASLTSSIVFPGKTPFAVHVEYAGEDSAYAGRRRLGDTDFSVGIDWPKLPHNLDLTVELSEWQNAWYVHHLYPDGMTNYGDVTGNWFGDQTLFQDSLGGHSRSLKLGWRRDAGDYLQLTYRGLSFDSRWRWSPGYQYVPMRELQLSYTRDWRGRAVEGDLVMGRDATDKSFLRVAGSVDLVPTTPHDADSADYDSPDGSGPQTEVFVDVGANESSVRKILSSTFPDQSTPYALGYHAGLGARRAVSESSDLGARVEIDNVDQLRLISVRALDYRYRWGEHFAIGAFFGVGRYATGLPAYGYYMGGGLAWRNVLPKWDLGLDLRHHDKLGRDKTLPTDPPATIERSREFFDVSGLTLYVSRRL